MCGVSGGGTGANSASATAAGACLVMPLQGSAACSRVDVPAKACGQARLGSGSGFHGGELGLCSPAPRGTGTRQKRALRCHPPGSPPFSPNPSQLLRCLLQSKAVNPSYVLDTTVGVL